MRGPDPIATRQDALHAQRLNLNEYINLLQLLSSTETVFDCLFTFAHNCNPQGKKVRLLCVLQGPYDTRPYLPPSSGRWFTAATVKDLNLPLCDFTFSFEFVLPRLKTREVVNVGPVTAITKDQLLNTMFMRIGEVDTICMFFCFLTF
jgi:hypothetical protein